MIEETVLAPGRGAGRWALLSTLNPGDVVEVTTKDGVTVKGPLSHPGTLATDELVIKLGASTLWVKDYLGNPGMIMESVVLIKKAPPEWAAEDVALIRAQPQGRTYGRTYARTDRGGAWRELGTGDFCLGEDIQRYGEIEILARFEDGVG